MTFAPNKWQRLTVPESMKNGIFWDKRVNELWTCYTSESKIFNLRVRYMPDTKWGNMRHLMIFKYDCSKVDALLHSAMLDLINSRSHDATISLSTALQILGYSLNNEINGDVGINYESPFGFLRLYPSCEDMAWILKTRGQWGKVAVEVYPTASNLMDGDSFMYHLWEFESEDVLPFPYNEVLAPPSMFDSSVIIKGTKIEYADKDGYINGQRFKYLYLRRADKKPLTWYQKQHSKDYIYSSEIAAVQVITEEASSKDYVCLVCLPYDFKFGFGLFGRE